MSAETELSTIATLEIFSAAKSDEPTGVHLEESNFDGSVTLS